MFFREGILLHLDKQAFFASDIATGTLRVWRAAQVDRATIPISERRLWESRMPCADKPWRFGGHDLYARIMIRHFGRGPSGNQSAAGCGKCQ